MIIIIMIIIIIIIVMIIIIIIIVMIIIIIIIVMIITTSEYFLVHNLNAMRNYFNNFRMIKTINGNRDMAPENRSKLLVIDD